jgi:hypothetical protein
MTTNRPVCAVLYVYGVLCRTSTWFFGSPYYCPRDIVTATGISGHFSTTLTDVFTRFFLSCKGITRKDGARTALPIFFIVMYVPFSVFCVLFMCKCVLYYCHRVSTQLQLKIINNNNIYCLTVGLNHAWVVWIVPPCCFFARRHRISGPWKCG